MVHFDRLKLCPPSMRGMDGGVPHNQAKTIVSHSRMTNVLPPAGTHLNVDAEESDAEDVHPPMVPNDSNVESEDGESDHSRAEAEVPAAMEPSVRRYPLRHRRPPDRFTT